MFAPDHKTTAAELVRVCRNGGRVVMTTWMRDGFAGQLFKLMGGFMPPPPPEIEGPLLWGDPAHIDEVFRAAGRTASIEEQTVHWAFASTEQMVSHYEQYFGPFALARTLLEPAGRWDELIGAFRGMVEQFDTAPGVAVRVPVDYFLITVSC